MEIAPKADALALQHMDTTKAIAANGYIAYAISNINNNKIDRFTFKQFFLKYRPRKQKILHKAPCVRATSLP